MASALIAIQTFAQTPKSPPPAQAPKSPPAQAPKSPPPAQPAKPAGPASSNSTTRKAGTTGVGLGILFGSDGLGLSLGKCISKKGKMYFQVSGTYAKSAITSIPYSFTGTNVLIDATVKLGAISAVFEYHPFGNAFKISAGAAYMLTNISATALLKDSTKQNDITLSPNEVGDIKFGLSTNPVCPYVGIGFGRAVPRKRAAFNFELGGFYISQPLLSFKTTGMLEPTSSQEGTLKSNMSFMNWIPSLRMGLYFKLGKL